MKRRLSRAKRNVARRRRRAAWNAFVADVLRPNPLWERIRASLNGGEPLGPVTCTWPVPR